MQDIADHRPRGRSHDADHLWQVGQRAFAFRGEQPLGRQHCLAFFQQRHQRAHARGFDILDHDLVFRLPAKGGDAPRGNHLHPLFRLGFKPC